MFQQNHRHREQEKMDHWVGYLAMVTNTAYSWFGWGLGHY
jgi:hypothetical protein